MSDHSKIKAALQAKLDELLDRAEEIEKELGTPGSSDWEESAIESEDDEVLAKLSDATEDEIEEIQLAILRIDSGHYGTCVLCDQPISKERLAAIPYATRCIDCA